MFIHLPRRLRLGPSLLIVGLVASALLSAQAPPSQTVVVTGRVVLEGSGTPIRRAHVIVHGPDTKTTRVTMSDLDGAFRFEGLPPDRYRVGAGKRPYLSAAVDAPAGQAVIVLRAGAIVTGTLVDPSGRPLSLDVTLSGPSLASVMTTTSGGGTYRFHGLPAGTYTMAVARRSSSAGTITVGDDQLGTEVLVPAVTVQPAERSAPPNRQVVANGTGVIEGDVRDVRTGEPMADVIVAMERTDRTTTTDGAGRFRFEGLAAATYGFRAQGPGFAPASSASVPLTQGGLVNDVSLRAGRFGSISGAVRDDVGDPVVGMVVSAFRRQSSNFTPIFLPRGFDRTDDRGLFNIRALPPGEYLLCACAGEGLGIDPLLLRRIGPTAPPLATVSRMIDETVHAYAPTYFPGVSRQVESLMVDVQFGEDRTAMDITVRGVTPYAVSGRLVELGGPPTQPMQLFLMQDGDLPGSIGVSEMRPAEVSGDGRFRFTGVPPGQYGVAAIPVAQQLKEPTAFLPITVVDSDVNDLVVALGAGLSVSGRVEFSGSAVRPAREVMVKTRVSLFPLDISARMFVAMGTSASVGHSSTLDEFGAFSMKGLAPGRYLVSVSVPNEAGRTVNRVQSSDATVFNNILTIGTTGADDVLVHVTETPLATIEGSVQLDRYEPPGVTRIVVFPTNTDWWLEPEQHAARFQMTFVNAGPTYRIANLPEGDYFVAIVSSFDYEMSASNLARWAKTAERITLRAGSPTRLDLKR